MPDQYGALIARVRGWIPPEVPIATHCHDDFGLALANAVAGLQAGADQVQATLGGIGERAGNTAWEELAALLAYKGDHLGLYTDIDLGAMHEAYTALRGVIRLEEPRNKAIFGAYAFGTAAGIHQQGLLANPATYEYVEPARFGRERMLLVGRHSGRAVLRHVLDQAGIEVGDAELAELYRVHIAERDGSDCEDLESLERRLARALRRAPRPGKVVTVRASRSRRAPHRIAVVGSGPRGLSVVERMAARLADGAAVPAGGDLPDRRGRGRLRPGLAHRPAGVVPDEHGRGRGLGVLRDRGRRPGPAGRGPLAGAVVELRRSRLPGAQRLRAARPVRPLHALRARRPWRRGCRPTRGCTACAPRWTTSSACRTATACASRTGPISRPTGWCWSPATRASR